MGGRRDLTRLNLINANYGENSAYESSRNSPKIRQFSIPRADCFLIFLFFGERGRKTRLTLAEHQTVFTVVIREEGLDVAPSRID